MFVCPECGAAQPAPGSCSTDGAQVRPVGDDALLGTTVGAYRVARLLGVGGMGRVYKGVHPNIGSRVAIKVLSRECSERRDLVERFFAEARAVNLIRHESIVNVLDLATLPDGRPYIIMEYLDGAPLSGVVEVARLRAQPLPLGGLARLAAEVLDALDAAHGKGIVHRDLKPDNVFVTPSGRAKVLDFGIAKLSDTPLGSATRTGSLLGTPHYMSPEQASGRPVDHRTDIYAMGVILFECATGQKPFNAESLFDLLRKHIEAPPPSPRALRPDLPVPLEQVILTALAKAPEARFANAKAMSMALQQATQQLPQGQWATITGSGDAVVTSPQLWAPSVPASWSGSRDQQVPATPSPPPPMQASVLPSGQVAPVTAVPIPASPRKGLWIGLALMLLLGGGIAAGVLATGGADKAPDVTAPPVVADRPAASPDESKAPDEPNEPNEPGEPDESKAPDEVERPANDRLHKLRDTQARLAKKLEDDLSKELDEGLAEATEVLGGGSTRAPASGGGWPTRQGLSFALDPAHVDVAKLIAFAVTEAKRQVPDAELFRIDADGVGPDGFANLELPSLASDHGSIDLRFRSPARSKRDPDVPLGVKQKWECEFRIEAEPDGVQIRPVSGLDCSKETPVPAPRCTPADLWKRAIAKKAPATNAVANLGYRATGNRIIWYFDIGAGTDRIFSATFSDDCR
ncbi:MAG: serine/threonine-protein kinase [Kofleriaceae bacterium]|nr:serine/threonine-protein kinase [Kofleriaceae bacterium]